MLSDNFNVCAISKYTNKYTIIISYSSNMVNLYAQQLFQHGRNQQAHLHAWRQCKYCPEKCKPIHPMAISTMSIHTASKNHNTGSVNTHINIRPVAILEQLQVWWQLIQTETVDMITIIIFTKMQTTCQFLFLNWLEPINQINQIRCFMTLGTYTSGLPVVLLSVRQLEMQGSCPFPNKQTYWLFLGRRIVGQTEQQITPSRSNFVLFRIHLNFLNHIYSVHYKTTYE